MGALGSRSTWFALRSLMPVADNVSFEPIVTDAAARTNSGKALKADVAQIKQGLELIKNYSISMQRCYPKKLTIVVAIIVIP